ISRPRATRRSSSRSTSELSSTSCARTARINGPSSGRRLARNHPVDPTKHPHREHSWRQSSTETGIRRRKRESQPEHAELRLLALRDALRAAKQGDFSVRLDEEEGDDPYVAELVRDFNALVGRNEQLVRELDRIVRVVTGEGNVEERVSLGPATG